MFKINANFDIEKINDAALLKTIGDSLNEAKKLNAYLTKKNKIISNVLNIYTQPAFQFSEQEMVTIKKLTKGLSYDEIFFLARDFAFNKEHKKARLLCNYILNELPNYGDVRTLKARTELSVKLAQAYQRTNAIPKAEKIMDSIIKKYPKNTEYLKIKKSFKE